MAAENLRNTTHTASPEGRCSDPAIVERNEFQVERNISPAENTNSPIKKKRGGWNAAILLLVNQGLQTLAFFGVGVNLVLFLTRVLGQDNAVAANNVSQWTGTVYLFSLLGAFLSDSYWGRYRTCALFQLILILGLVLLSIASSIFLLHPHGCGNGDLACIPPSRVGVILFYLAIYLVALGYGGHQPTLGTLGADQFDDLIPKEKIAQATFFSYFYFALNVGCMFSNTILVYYEDIGMWTLGFLVSLGSAVLALVTFLMGTKWYRHVKPCGNPVPRLAQVVVATVRKRKVTPSENAAELYELEGTESSIKGSRKILHSNKFKFMDKAATVTAKDTVTTNPWRLCTVTQVEEAKCVMKMIPIWLCTIIYSVIFTQMASLFVEQGDVMDAHIGKFHIPAASMSIFDVFAVMISTMLYRYVIFPVAAPTALQRMGVGLIIGLLSMVAAGATEIFRLRRVVSDQKVSQLSIFWQVPQYALVGASEVFMYVGQIEFFNGQAPDGIKSFGTALCMASISLGNFVSSLLVNMVMQVTAKGEKPGWIPANLNNGNIDRFYFLIAILAAIDFVLFLFCAKWYEPIQIGSGGRTDGAENERVREMDEV